MEKTTGIFNLSLYAAELGGRPTRASGRSLIEQHDITFLVGPHNLSEENFIKNFWPEIKNSWREASNSFHIDGFIELKVVDGYKIAIRKTTEMDKTNNLKLFFIAAGGYREGVFGEQHEYIFTVATSKNEAKENLKKNHPFLNQGIIGKKNGPNPHIDTSHSFSVTDIHELLNIGKMLRHRGFEIICIPLEGKEAETPNKITLLGFGRGRD